MPLLATQEHLGDRCCFDSSGGLGWSLLQEGVVQQTHSPSMTSRCLTQARRHDFTVLGGTGKGKGWGAVVLTFSDFVSDTWKTGIYLKYL